MKFARFGAEPADFKMFVRTVLPALQLHSAANATNIHFVPQMHFLTGSDFDVTVHLFDTSYDRILTPWCDLEAVAVVDRIYRKDFDFMEMAFDAFHQQAFSDGSTTQLSIRESAPVRTNGKPLQTFRAMLQARNTSKRGECGHEDTSKNGHVKIDNRSSAKRSAETTATTVKRHKNAPTRQLTLSETLKRQAASKQKCTTTRQLTLPDMLSRQTCL